jgi:hypothetical protein
LNLLTTIESGLTAEQIALLVDADERIDEVKADVIELDQKHNTEINDINSMLNSKVNITDVYTKSEIDSKGYLTEHQSLAGYATENWVYQRGYISAETDPIWSAEKHKYALKSELPSTAGFATESWVKEQGYITEHQSLAGYATEDWVKEQNYLTEHQSLAGYATESWVKEQGYITEHQSLADYYTKSEVDAAFENVEVDVDLTGYATEAWCAERYITRHVEGLIYYYRKTQIDEMMTAKLDTNKIWSGTQAE